MARNQIHRFGAYYQVLLLIIALCIVHVIQSQAQIVQIPLKVETKNWLQITENNWPNADPDPDPQKDKTFYLFHKENRGESFSFVKDILKWDKVYGKPNLKFKYWANSDEGRFRQSSASEFVDLKVEKKWTEFQLKDLSPAEWNYRIISGASGDDYTLAFKDIQLKYIEKIGMDNVTELLIHGYRDSAALAKQDKDKMNKNVVNPSNVLSIGVTKAKIEFINKVYFHGSLPKDKNILTFKLQLFPSGMFQEFKLKPNGPNNNGCIAEPSIKEVEFKCEIVTSTIENTNHQEVKSLNVTLKKEQGFIISNIKTISKDKLNDNQFKPQINVAPHGNGYTLNKTGDFVFQIGTQPDAQDLCYTMINTQAPNLQVEIYLTLEMLKQGIKLTAVRDASYSFCINDFVALRNLKNVQLTFVPIGEIKKEFNLILAKYTSSEKFNPKRPDASKASQITQAEISPAWYFYNSELFDYTIHGEGDDVQKVQFWICDVVANCFKFNRKFSAPGKVHFTVPNDYDKYKEILDNSPFVRIVSDGVAATSKFTFDYHMTIFGKIINNFKTLNPNLPKSISGNEFTLEQPKDQKALTLKVPINGIDLRVHKFSFSISNNNSKVAVSISRLTFKYDKIAQPNDLTEMFKYKRPGNEVVTIKTEDLFYVEKFETKAKAIVNGYFEIALNVVPEADKDSMLNIKLKLENNEVEPATKVDQTSKVTFPNIPKSPKNNFLLTKLNPRIIISTGLIRSSFDQKVPKYDVKFSFGSEDNKTLLKPQNVQVTQIITSQTLISTNTKAVQQLNVKDDNVTGYVQYGSEQDKIDPSGNAFSLMYIIDLVAPEETTQIWINVEKFEIGDPEKFPKSPQTGTVYSTFDTRYDASACPSNFKRTGTSCELEQIFQEKVVQCIAPGCPEIFSGKMAYSLKYAPSSPVQYIPYRGDLAPDQSIPTSYLMVVKPKENPANDFCVEFNAVAQPLVVSVSSTSEGTLAIEFADGQNKICASLLTNDLSKVQGLVFRLPKINGVIQDSLDSNVIKISNPTSAIALNTLETGIFLGESLKDRFFSSQFLIDYKTNEIKISELQTKKTELNKSPIYYLRSKWIKAPNKVKTQIHLTLKPEGSDLSKEFLTSVSLIFASPSQPNLAEKKLSDINTTAVNVIDIAQSDYYQLIIGIQLDLSKIKDEKDFSLNLSQLSVNDPCLEITTGEQRNCNQKASPAQGHCVPAYDTFTSECVCEPGFSKADSCKSIDYCSRIKDKTTNETYETFCSRFKGCVNTANNFECKCGNDKLRWDNILQDCIEKEITPCAENQVRQKVNGQYVCDCIEGYVKIENVCVLYNPCLEDHRKVKNIKPEIKPCGDVKATCAVKQDSPDGYECICGADYFNEFGNKAKNAACKHNLCNSCQHYCELKDKVTREYECKCYQGYTPNNDRCDPDGKIDTTKCHYNETNKIEGAPEPFFSDNGIKNCKCVPGFFYDSAKSVCQVDFSPLVARKLYGCDTKLEINKDDKKLGCACWDLGLKMDPITRSCLPECSEERTNMCGQSKATCAYDRANKKASCKCKNGEIAFASDKSKPIKWICLPKCSLLDRSELYERKCIGQFQHCDPSQFKFNNLYSDGLQEVFLYNSNSSINTTSQHCQCEVGFSMHNRDKPQQQQSCELTETPIRYIRDMQFDLISSATSDEDKKRFTEKVQNAVNSLIISLFNAPPVETKCDPKENKVHCDIGFATVLNQEQIKLNLKTNCNPVLEKDQKEATKCMFLTREMQTRTKRSVWFSEEDSDQEMEALEPVAPTFSNTLMCDVDVPTNVKIEDLDYCIKADRCRANYERSQCRTKNINNQFVFECFCDSDIFDIQSTVPKVFNGQSLEMHSCKLKDLCNDKEKYGCADPNALCNLMVEYDDSANKYTPKSFCSCPDSKLALSSRDRSCKNSCDGYCVNGDCAHDVFDAKRIVCHCHDGFNGTKCEEKLNYYTEVTGVSSGYKTATIILSVFFGLGLLVLVVFAVRRYTSFDFVYYISRVFRREQNSMQQHSQQQQHSHQPPPRQNVAQNIPLERRTPANQ